MKNECLVVPASQVFGYDKYEVNEGSICSFKNDFFAVELLRLYYLNLSMVEFKEQLLKYYGLH